MAIVIRILAGIGAFVTVAGVFFLISVRGFSAREPPNALEARFVHFVRAATTPSVTRPALGPLEDARPHWADHCAGCHGADGRGDAAITMAPPVPDMRAAATQAFDDGQLYWIIQHGVRFSGMPAWGEARDDDAATWALVDFIRTLPSLAPEDVAVIKRAMPMSEHERRERDEEDAFLNGAVAPAPQ